MLFSSLDTLLKLSKTTSPNKLFAYDCITLYYMMFPFLPHRVLLVLSTQQNNNGILYIVSDVSTKYLFRSGAPL